MSIAILTPQPGGKCVWECNGQVHAFDSYALAVEAVEATGMQYVVEPFHPTPLVLAESPALRNNP